MAAVVCVHGIGQQFSGEAQQHGMWFPALADGLRRAGEKPLGLENVTCAFYGDLYRRAARTLADADPPYDATDVEPGLETDLLLELWREAARSDPAVVPPEGRTLVATPRHVQRALDALSHSRFFAGMAMRAVISDLKQVRAYLCDSAVRAAVQDRVAATVGPDTLVVIGHSLGSVVAYEALCLHPEWSVRALVTIGSPLGIRNLVYDRLAQPGQWPGGVAQWTNIAAGGDVVALVKDLRPLFGSRVVNVLVENGSHAHDATRYLDSLPVGRAVADGLRTD